MRQYANCHYKHYAGKFILGDNTPVGNNRTESTIQLMTDLKKVTSPIRPPPSPQKKQKIYTEEVP